jgi:putative intracellular protease/amidase
MNTSLLIRVGAVLFDRFELLDFYGPLEMFGLLAAEAKITVVADKAGSLGSSSAPGGVAEATMADCRGFDVLLIPGGIGLGKKWPTRNSSPS